MYINKLNGQKLESEGQTISHLRLSMSYCGGPCPWGVLPIMAHTGRLRPKGVPFSGFRYIKNYSTLVYVVKKELDLL